MATDDSTTAYVYFISAGSSPIKIGVANDPIARLRGLQTVHYKRLHLLYTIQCGNRARAFELEAAFHRWYASDRLSGEWFDLSPSAVWEDIELLRGLARSISVEKHIDGDTLAKMEATIAANERKKAMSPKLELAMNWLHEHLDQAGLSDRKIAAMLGISHPWVAKARKELSTQ